MASGSIINNSKSSIYSTTNEILVGTYNGENIYRQCFVTTAPTTQDGTNTEKFVAHVPMKDLISLSATAGTGYALPYTSNSGRTYKVFVNGTSDITLVSNGSAFNSMKTLVVIEYTKNT